MIYFIVIFIAYIFTLYPTISPYRDSGDLISAAYTLGIAHPPGYPLYSLLGKIFLTIVPFGNPAYRLNLMSAIMGALAVALLAKNSRGWSRLLLISLGFTIPFWRLSIVSEMYSINGFFVALLLVLVGKAVLNCCNYSSEKSLRYFAAVFFLVGVACGNHLTVILVLPPLALLLFLLSKYHPGRYIFSFKNILWFMLFFVLGASVFVYLPVRASANPVVNWGNPSNLERFLRVITRADYGGLKLHPEESIFVWSAGGVGKQLFFYLKLLRKRFGVVPILFALIGAFGVVSRFYRKDVCQQHSSTPSSIINQLKNSELIGAFTLGGFIVSGPLFSLLANLPVGKSSTIGILEPHFVMADVFFASLGALGALEVFAIDTTSKNYIVIIIKKILVRLALVLAFLYIIMIFLTKSTDYRYNFSAYDYARNILATSPPAGRTIIYDPDDTTTFTLDYYQYVLKERTDVTKAVYFRTRWGYDRLRKFSPDILPAREISSGKELAYEIISYNLAGKKVILSELPSKFPGGSVVVPDGILHRIFSLPPTVQGATSYSVHPNAWSDKFWVYFMRGMETRDAAATFSSGKLDFTRDFFNEHIISYYTSALVNNGLYLAQNKVDVAKARKFYLQALAISDDIAPAWNNLGTLAFGAKDYRAAALFFEKSYAIEPDNPIGAINAGLAYRRAGEVSRAQSLFEGVLKKGFNPSAANELGLIYYEKGDYVKAEKIFLETIKHFPQFPEAYYNLALVYAKTRPELAEKYFEIYRRLGAGN